MPHLLDDIVWASLTGPHAALSEGGASARRYPPAFAPFHAVAAQTPAHFKAMAELAGPDDRIVTFTPADIDPGPDCEVLTRAPIVQMVRLRSTLPAPPAHVVPLTPADAADMRSLAEETKPGPFASRTHELGSFFGIRVDGRLVAMAGERMRLAGYTEVSAVCTLPDFRGRRYAEQLVDAVCQGIFDRGETAVLHAFSDNLGAIGLYRKLGFAQRGEFRVTMMRKAVR
jgi:ribosomal protein S18 acetylase RimI-like enzyme